MVKPLFSYENPERRGAAPVEPSVFVGQKQGRDRAVGLGDYPELHARFRELVGGQDSESLFYREFILAPVVFGQFAPVAGDVAIE